MRTIEFGQGNRDVIMLLHGGGLNWWNYREAALILAERYHVVLPVLDGHAGSGRSFEGMEACAMSLIELIDSRFGGRVALLGGVSLGAQVLTEMLALRSELCRCAIIESALVIPMRMTHALIGPSVKMSYGLIRRQWFAKLQFRYLGIPPELFEDYYRDTCGIGREEMASFLRANAGYSVHHAIADTKARVYICVGGKESGVMRRSAKKLHALIPGSTLKVMENRIHGEFSLKHAGEYAQTAAALLNGQL